MPCCGDWTGRPAKLEMTHIFQAHVPPVGDPLFDVRLRGTLIGQDVVKLTLAANHVEEDYSF